MIEPLPCNALRWRCDPDRLEFETTADVDPVAGVIGQSSAVDALSFGLEIDAPGQNVFIRGLTGTGRMTLVQRLLEVFDLALDQRADAGLADARAATVVRVQAVFLNRRKSL